MSIPEEIEQLVVIVDGPQPASSLARRDALVNDVSTVEQLCEGFDLTAFPLPVRVGMNFHGFLCPCKYTIGTKTVHVHMRIKPRSEDELWGVSREPDGTIELRNCTGITQAELDKPGGNQEAVEKIRKSIHSMVMHEVYESLMFRGMRIMDPHDGYLRPADQEF